MKSSNYGKKNEVTHIGYLCNECERDPIVGTRFHCQECEDYDLCERCYTKSLHKHHKIIPITQTKKPAITAQKVIEDYLLKSMKHK